MFILSNCDHLQDVMCQMSTSPISDMADIYKSLYKQSEILLTFFSLGHM